MGNSAMDHRAQIGLFAGRMCSSSWSPSTGAFKVSGTRPESDPDSARSFLLNVLLVVGTLGLMVGVWNHITVPISGLRCVSTSCISPPASQLGTLTEVEVVMERTAGQVKRLIMMSGNVERNPGPPQPVPPFNRWESTYMVVMDTTKAGLVLTFTEPDRSLHISLSTNNVIHASSLLKKPPNSGPTQLNSISYFLPHREGMVPFTLRHTMSAVLSVSSVQSKGDSFLVPTTNGQLVKAPLASLSSSETGTVERSVMVVRSVSFAPSTQGFLLRNGVAYTYMKVMANAMLDTMIKEGKVNYRVLAHIHNWVPFLDYRILEASAEDIKLFISTVMRPVCKVMCLKTKERELVRQMILKGYGSPDTCTSLNLTQLGDLLMVLSRSDLAAVKPTSLRGVVAQLSANNLWTTLLTDVRSSTKPVLYHEAIGAWLGGKGGGQSQDAIQTYNQRNMMGQFIVSGSFLEVEVLMNELVVPKPRNSGGFSRRKRQAADDGIDYKSIYSLIMNDTKTKFDAKEFTDDQKTEDTRVITEIQKMLGDTGFGVLGLKRGDKIQSEVPAVLSEYKDAGNMTEEQNTRIQKLAVDTKVCMIQELVTVLGLTATDPELTTDQWDTIMARQTFVIKPQADARPEEASGDDKIRELLTTTEENLAIAGKEAPNSTSEPATESFEVETEATDLGVNGQSTVLPETAPSTTSVASSASYTTSSTAASSTSSSTTSTTVASSTSTSTTSTTVSSSSQSTTILVVEKEDIGLSCDVIIAAGSSASSISASVIASMFSKEVTNCLDTMGHLPWPQAVTESIRNAGKTKVTKLQGANMLQLQNLLPAIALVDYIT